MVESIQCDQHKLFNKEFNNIYLFDDFHYNWFTTQEKHYSVFEDLVAKCKEDL